MSGLVRQKRIRYVFIEPWFVTEWSSEAYYADSTAPFGLVNSNDCLFIRSSEDLPHKRHALNDKCFIMPPNHIHGS